MNLRIKCKDLEQEYFDELDDTYRIVEDYINDYIDNYVIPNVVEDYTNQMMKHMKLQPLQM